MGYTSATMDRKDDVDEDVPDDDGSFFKWWELVANAASALRVAP